jgi:hypothetical protein
MLIFASVALGLVTPQTVVSGPSIFAGCTDGQSEGPPPGEVFVNAEVEPWIAVNPANPANLVGVWQQDRWTDGGSHGLNTVYSTNGGVSWTVAGPFPGAPVPARRMPRRPGRRIRGFPSGPMAPPTRSPWR